jgi:hypothetical protein
MKSTATAWGYSYGKARKELRRQQSTGKEDSARPAHVALLVAIMASCESLMWGFLVQELVQNLYNFYGAGSECQETSGSSSPGLLQLLVKPVDCEAVLLAQAPRAQELSEFLDCSDRLQQFFLHSAVAPICLRPLLTNRQNWQRLSVQNRRWVLGGAGGDGSGQCKNPDSNAVSDAAPQPVAITCTPVHSSYLVSGNGRSRVQPFG